MDTERLLTVAEVANHLGVSVSYLNKARVYGTGPEFTKLGRAVRYERAKVAEWVDQRRRQATSA